MALTRIMFDQLVDNELESIIEEQDWNSVRKYIAADYKSRSEERLREMYEERFKPAYITLVNELITAGCKISVFDGGEYNLLQSTDADSILAAIESVEEAELLIYVPNRPVLWAQVSPYGLAPDETVIDHTIGLEQYAPSLKVDIAEG